MSGIFNKAYFFIKLLIANVPVYSLIKSKITFRKDNVFVSNKSKSVSFTSVRNVSSSY